MGRIEFEDWKNKCGIEKYGNDKEKTRAKAEEYKNNNFGGKNQFVITFKQWAELEGEDMNNFKTFVLTGANNFYIENNENERVSSQNLKNFPDKEYFNNWDFYKINDKKNITEITSSSLYEEINDENGKDRIYYFYTMLFLWCLKKAEGKMDPSVASGGGTGLFIKLKNTTDVHLGINADKLGDRAQKLIKEYLIDDYHDYKIIFTPKNKNNGGNNDMTEVNTKDNTNIDINELIERKISKHQQIIFTGAPGTGKTHSVREYVKKETKNDENRYKFVQFHSSYDYTDFVEGIRPVPKDGDGENMFVRMDGTFKAFCRKIVEKNIETLKENYGFSDSDINDLYYEYESKKDNEKIKQKRKDNAIKIKNIIKKARDEKTDDFPEYYFIIDEINRADLSKVFGELMFGLEEDYRGVQNRFPTQYSNLPTYCMADKTEKAVLKNDDCFKKGFFVPENLTIIGTMNDIDRSVETFDFALRRRFAWVEIKANKVMLNSVVAINSKENEEIDNEEVNKIVKQIINMNKVISEDKGKKLGLNESYHIGPAYFKNLFNGNDVKENLITIFDEKIEPILREYTRGRDSKTISDFVDKCREKLLDEKSNNSGEETDE